MRTCKLVCGDFPARRCRRSFAGPPGCSAREDHSFRCARGSMFLRNLDELNFQHLDQFVVGEHPKQIGNYRNDLSLWRIASCH